MKTLVVVVVVMMNLPNGNGERRSGKGPGILRLINIAVDMQHYRLRFSKSFIVIQI